MKEYFKKGSDIVSTNHQITKNFFLEEGYEKISNEEGEKVERIEKALSEIESLKIELSTTDYQVIKNYELSLIGLPLDYDPIELHNKRQEKRDRINELQLEIDSISI